MLVKLWFLPIQTFPFQKSLMYRESWFKFVLGVVVLITRRWTRIGSDFYEVQLILGTSIKQLIILVFQDICVLNPFLPLSLDLDNNYLIALR